MLVSGVGYSPPVEAPLSAFGVISPRVTFRSRDDDEFVFEQKGSVLSANTFAYGNKIQINKYVNGTKTIWFIGTVSKITVVGNAQYELVRYVVSGPWFKLKTTMWQVASQCYQASVNGAPCILASTKMTKVVLFQDPITGLSITTGTQIANVITYAQTLGISIGPGVAPAFVNVPFDETRDLTLAAVINRCMQWTPQGVTWFTYTSGTPILNAQDRGSLSAVSLDLSLENLVTAFELNPRFDLVPTGVRFNYVGISSCNVEVPNGCVDPSTGILNTGVETLSQDPVTVQTITQDVAGIPDSAQGLIGTIDLQQLTGTTTENAPIGLASQYYAYLQTIQYDGTVTTHEQECSGTLRPGNVLNLLNGQTSWATMKTVIQEVTENLYTGETTAKVGTPQHLAPQTFAYLINLTARRPLVVSGLSAVNTPGASGNNCPQGISPETQKVLNKLSGSGSAAAVAIGNAGLGRALPSCSLTVCSGGQSKTISVYCSNPNQ
jgi:hypothetical protein